jgi:creatinine amidohydrolase/Fe(II)-dependent formamide hydrolase-like protein
MSAKLRNWGREVDSGSWEDQFSITTGASDLSLVAAKTASDATGKSVVVAEAVYSGASAIAIANYAGFPIGSKILDLQAGQLLVRTDASKADATGWKKIALVAIT